MSAIPPPWSTIPKDDPRPQQCVECGSTFSPKRGRGRFRLTCGDDCKKRRRRRSVRLSQRRIRQRQLLEAAVLLPDDAPPGRRHAIGPRQLLEIQAAMRGVAWGHRQAVVADIAARLGTSERAVYRAARLGPPVHVVIGRWEAWFASRPNGGMPVQLTEWRGITSWDATDPP